MKRAAIATTLPSGSSISNLLGANAISKLDFGVISRGKGQQFTYGFDDIGNRTSTGAGGDENGANLRTANYSANNLNQYTSRTVPGSFDVLGVELATNSVSVDGMAPYRHGEYFRKEVSTNNSSTPVWAAVDVTAPTETRVHGNVFVPKTPEQFYYDLDGNLTNDGHWTYYWDAENRLVAMKANTAVGPQISLKFEFDSKSRRIHKQVYSDTTWTTCTNDLEFAYDGWNLIGQLSTIHSPLLTLLWGLDLSGSLQGAGGIGGLISLNDASSGVNFVAFDGNGNVAALEKATDSTQSALYEYSPFGEIVRATGPEAKSNPFLFSTKYQDSETDLCYYGYRSYNPQIGRWLSRDPSGERGGVNLFQIVRNEPLNGVDPLGLRRASSDAFNVTFEPYHYYTKVSINFHSGRDGCGNLRCQSPKLAQIAVDFGGSLGHQLNPFGLPGEWFLDTDSKHKPWYPYQVPFGDGVVNMVDAPGARWYHPTDWIWSFYQFFETCAVCTDAGPGKYKIIGCINWGHHIAGIGASSRWGDGVGIAPVPPSADFIRLFK